MILLAADNGCFIVGEIAGMTNIGRAAEERSQYLNIGRWWRPLSNRARCEAVAL
jgi:hypothetical protein